MNLHSGQPRNTPKTIYGLAKVCESAMEMMEDRHMTTVGTARILGVSPNVISGQDSALARYRRGGIFALMPKPTRSEHAGCRLTLGIESLGWFVHAVRFFYFAEGNRTRRGSLPRAVKRAMSLPRLPNGWRNPTRRKFLATLALNSPPVCPPALRALLRQRARAGRPIVPERIARQIKEAPGRRHIYTLELPVEDMLGLVVTNLAKRLANDHPEAVVRLTFQLL